MKNPIFSTPRFLVIYKDLSLNSCVSSPSGMIIIWPRNNFFFPINLWSYFFNSICLMIIEFFLPPIHSIEGSSSSSSGQKISFFSINLWSHFFNSIWFMFVGL